MNKKVFISMLVLTISFLVSFYVLKIFFPQEFVMSIQNEQLIKIGTFIDTHKWAYYICSGFTSFVIYWLFLCGCKGKLHLSWKECLAILISIILSFVIKLYDVNITSHIRIISFFIIPMMFNMDLKRATIIYSFHGLAQILSLGIRNLPMYLTCVNSIISICITFECYLWLLLFYIIFNYKKKEI